MTLHVTAPAGIRVERMGVASGDVEVTAVRGPATANTSSGDVSGRDVDGDVEVIDPEGDVSVEASSGDVTVADPGGDVDVSASSGDVSIRFRAEAGATVSAEAGSGNVETSGLDVSTDGSTLETTVGDGPRTVDVSTSSGDVEIVEDG